MNLRVSISLSLSLSLSLYVCVYVRMRALCILFWHFFAAVRSTLDYEPACAHHQHALGHGMHMMHTCGYQIYVICTCDCVCCFFVKLLTLNPKT
jgi:hypothetical protein